MGPVVVSRFEGMQLGEVFRVLDALGEAGVSTWLEGGWGVDALVGYQTRAHRDVDVDVDVVKEAIALAALGDIGYVVETDWRPNRVELAAAGRGWVDVHPLLFDRHGAARQQGLNGELYDFPEAYFVTGHLEGRAVRCFSLEAQRAFHTGYARRPIDAHDLAQLDLLSGGSTPRSR
jgi:lincosamide nucleotidyltransferase A/C/D/E